MIAMQSFYIFDLEALNESRYRSSKRKRAIIKGVRWRKIFVIGERKGWFVFYVQLEVDTVDSEPVHIYTISNNLN